MNVFQRIDDQLIKSKPFVWILGLHIFIPLLMGCGLVLMAIGWFTPLEVEGFPYNGTTSTFTTMTLLVSLVSILLLILFIIRQIRFNSARIHYTLPYKYGIWYFLCFVLIMAAISALPMTANVGAYWQAKSMTSDVMETLYFNEQTEWEKTIPFNFQDKERVTELKGSEAYPEDLKRMAIEVHDKNGFFYPLRASFWKYYILISIFLSMMLYAICATKLRDFGWAMLISALFPIVFGITIAMLGNMGVLNGASEEGTIATILTIYVAFMAIMAFVPHVVKPATGRSYAIVIYLALPVLVMMYLMLLIDEDMVRYYAQVSAGVAVVATIVFNLFFKHKYVNPI